ncbi:MAG: hypothetical protein ACT4PT_04850 [Methanobacteriota archaeon]
MKRTYGLAWALASLVAVPLAHAADAPAWIPPDGSAAPAKSLSDILREVAVGSAVTTKPVKVSKVSCPSCESATVAADFWVTDGRRTLRVHVPHTWQATFNVKKQNFVPEVGMTVVVQGRLDEGPDGRVLTMKRFGERDHEGPTVHAYDVAAGKVPTGRFVWLSPATVLNVGHWDDGDFTFAVRDPDGGGFVNVELSPPFWGSLRIPHKGDVVQPYGMVRFDPDHSWWEIHPVRCWAPDECVPIRADYVRNAPPAGTPATGGSYLEGGPEPVWVPRSGSGTTGTLAASFHPHANSNEWWTQVRVDAVRPVVAVYASADGGDWKGLNHAWWGDWIRFGYVPAGSMVRFRAVADDGSFAVSEPVVWPP